VGLRGLLTWERQRDVPCRVMCRLGPDAMACCADRFHNECGIVSIRYGSGLMIIQALYATLLSPLGYGVTDMDGLQMVGCEGVGGGHVGRFCSYLCALYGSGSSVTVSASSN